MAKRSKEITNEYFAFLDAHLADIISGRVTEDIAPLVEFLVTNGWWITGQTIFANGGYTTR